MFRCRNGTILGSLQRSSPVVGPLTDGYVSPHATTLAEADREQRIDLAGLTARQAKKYRTTLAILEQSDRGLRTTTLAKRLSLTKVRIAYYRKHAPDTIEMVERKIDESYRLGTEGPWVSPVKTLRHHARPASESVVDAYKDTVLRMVQEGHSHRVIHAAIVKEGFSGSANAVYQYLLKYTREHAIPETWMAAGAPPRPPRIALARVARRTIYERLLHRAAVQREAIQQALTGLTPAVSETPNPQSSPSAPAPWVNTTQYDDRTAEIVFDTQPKEQGATKTLTEDAYARLEQATPCLSALLTCLVAFYTVLLSGDVDRLDRFIETYLHDAMEPLAVFASGLKKDLEAVKNCLRYPEISNGPMEGTNHKIKMVRRRGYGRAGVELLNALLVLPWYYHDLDHDRLGHPTAA